MYMSMCRYVHVSVGAHAWPKTQGAGVTSGYGLVLKLCSSCLGLLCARIAILSHLTCYKLYLYF